MPLRLTFLLTIALASTGRPGSDLERAQMLLDSMKRFVKRESIEKLLVITRPTDLVQVKCCLSAYEPYFDMVFMDETEVCPSFAGNPDTTNNWPRPNLGWVRQQLLKLAAHEIVSTPFYMTLDSDVLFTKPFETGSVIVDGRSKVNTETTDDYRRIYTPEVAAHEERVKQNRYTTAERILKLQRAPDRSDVWYGETPVIMSTAIVRSLTGHIESVSGLPWQSALLRDPSWTDYALYFLYAEASGTFDKYHFRDGCDAVLNLSQSLWWSPDSYSDGRSIESWPVQLVFDPNSPGCSVVVQSYLGIDPIEVRKRVSPYVG